MGKINGYRLGLSWREATPHTRGIRGWEKAHVTKQQIDDETLRPSIGLEMV